MYINALSTNKKFGDTQNHAKGSPGDLFQIPLLILAFLGIKMKLKNYYSHYLEIVQRLLNKFRQSHKEQWASTSPNEVGLLIDTITVNRPRKGLDDLINKLRVIQIHF